MKKTYVVTIARGFGSGGREVASRLADELNIHSYENRILTLAAQYSGRDEYDFVQVDEKLRKRYLLQQLSALQKRMTPRPQIEKFTSDDRLFQFQELIIRELAQTESCIIVGKCADYVLRDCSNVLRVYIEAPREFCVQRIMRRMDVTETEAHSLIAKTDKYRAEYYRYYTGGRRWNDPVNYDLTLNSAAWGIERCVEMIRNALEIKLGEDPLNFTKGSGG